MKEIPINEATALRALEAGLLVRRGNQYGSWYFLTEKGKAAIERYFQGQVEHVR